MKVLKTNPGAKRLIESLRNMGYDCSTAIADLVDNSVTAHASEIYIDILPKEGSRPALIYIADNGKGMDKDNLHEAMRFGSFQEYAEGDLGKYGLGLKTASLSQCRKLTVSSKAKSSGDARPRRNCMRWDLDHVYKSDEWDLLIPSEDEFKDWESKLLNQEVVREHGTVVLWEKLDESLPMLSSDNANEREKQMARLINEISSHLRMIFHRFMQGTVTGRRKLDIYVCGEKLVPWDPFCRTEKTKELDIVGINLTFQLSDSTKVKETITISPFVLPREDEFSSTEAWRDASGPKNWNQQQGFYFYRNNRLLQAGGWSRMRAVDEHLKLLRVAVDFSNELDQAFSINVTKMKAKVPDDLREKIAKHLTAWMKVANTRYRRIPVATTHHSTLSTPTFRDIEPIPEPASSVSIGPLKFSHSVGKKFEIAENKKTGEITLSIPDGHELSAVFQLRSGDKESLRKMCLSTLALLEAVHDKKIAPTNIPIKELKKIYRNI
ncbi:MAG: hypothetical protein JWO00_55 [Candidatus Parcubacteria bacterium]|nr:hypothetical protein [Candidatus Parcubacteria bacterium]